MASATPKSTKASDKSSSSSSSSLSPSSFLTAKPTPLYTLGELLADLYDDVSNVADTLASLYDYFFDGGEDGVSRFVCFLQAVIDLFGQFGLLLVGFVRGLFVGLLELLWERLVELWTQIPTVVGESGSIEILENMVEDSGLFDVAWDMGVLDVVVGILEGWGATDVLEGIFNVTLVADVDCDDYGDE